MNPLGPEPPSVYWRRRLLVGLAVLVLLILLLVLFKSCTGGSAPTGAPASPTAGATVTPSGSGSPSSSTTTASSDCAPEDIAVTVEMDKDSYSVGTPIVFKMLITNKSDAACNRNVGPKVNTFVVKSGSARVWSSDDCSPPGGDDVKAIPAGASYAVQATWNQKLTEQGCPSGQPSAEAGGYDVTATNDGVNSKTLSFAITGG